MRKTDSLQALMTDNRNLNSIQLNMAAAKIRYAVLPIERLAQLQTEIKDTLTNKISNQDLSEYISYAYNFAVQDRFLQAKSIIVAARYNPINKLIFMRDGKTVEVLIPPGYVSFRSKQTALQQSVSSIIEPLGFRIERIILPVKLLAVHSGLAEYGKNNICYIGDWGSFHFLGAFLSDLPADADCWRELKVLKNCANCTLCYNNCPAKAIDTEGFLIHAERCLTLYNRNPGDFPVWIDKNWHNSLFGCIKCQEICPYNHQVAQDIQLLDTFSESETAELLTDNSIDTLSDSIKGKLDKLGFPELLDLLKRNLRVLLL